MDKVQAIEAALHYAQKRGADEAEVFLTETKIFRLSSQKYHINDLKFSFAGGLTIRVIQGNRCSRAYTESLALDDIRNMVDQALEFAKYAPIHEDFSFTRPIEKETNVQIDSSRLGPIGVEQKQNMAVEIEKKGNNVDPDVNVSHAYYGDFSNLVLIGNSHGLIAGYAEEKCEILCGAQATHPKGTSFYVSSQTERDFAKLDPESLVKKVTQKAKQFRGAKRPEKGTYPVIFSPKAMSDFIRVFSPVFFAESGNLSRFFGKLNEQIVSPLLTIIDDPTLPYSGMRLIDDEGHPCKKRTVVENGVLSSYLYNNASAKRLGMEEGGNAFRRSFKTRVITAASNLYIQNGTAHPDDMMKTMHNGIYVEELQGLEGTFHWEYPHFSIRARGFRVENGTLSYPIDRFVLNGAIEELLNRVVTVGNDFRFATSINRQSFGSPSILFEQCDVLS